MTKEYPKCMVHPAHAPAVIGERQIDRLGRVSYGQSIPERFPKMWVEAPEQEEEARSRGYLALGEAPPLPVGFSEYPLMMAHPDHQDMIPDEIKAERQADGAIRTWTVPGVPEVHPHITVQNAGVEADWAARGYKRMGVSDPAASSSARAGYVPGTAAAEYPKWVDGQLVQDPRGPTPGPMQYPKWISSHECVVNSAEEEAALLGYEVARPAEVDVQAPIPEPVPDSRDDQIARLQRELAELRSVINRSNSAKLPKPPKRTREQAQRERRERERAAQT